jgi:hypothetical protein
MLSGSLPDIIGNRNVARTMQWLQLQNNQFTGRVRL